MEDKLQCSWKLKLHDQLWSEGYAAYQLKYKFQKNKKKRCAWAEEAEIIKKLFIY